MDKNGKQCQCKEGYYENNQICKQCGFQCKACSELTCKECFDNATPNKGSCQCNVGFYKDQQNQKCSLCPPQCNQTCFLDHNNEVQCSHNSCKIGQFYSFLNKQCEDCDQTCLTCSQSGQKCDSCDFKKSRYLQDGKCICMQKFYEKIVDLNKVCEPYPLYCQKISQQQNKIQCLECLDYEKFNRKNELNCPCLENFYDSGQPKCQPCEGCFSCNSKGECLKYCAENCSKCESNINECEKCKIDYFLQYGKCVNKCDENMMTNYVIKQCIKCQDSNCKNCSQETSKCLECFNGYKLQNDQCICPPKKYINENRICEHCYDQNCNRCIGKQQNQCIECKKYLQNGICVEKCSEDYYPESTQTQVCLQKCDKAIQNCKTCSYEKDSINIQIVNNIKCRVCQQKFYLENNQDKLLCLPCSENCLKCDKSSICDICIEGYFLNQQKKCIKKCQENFELDKNEECIQIITQIKYNLVTNEKEPNIFNIEFDKEIQDMNSIINNIQIQISQTDIKFQIQKIQINNNKIQIKINPINPINSKQKVVVHLQYKTKTIQLIQNQEYVDVLLFKEKPQNKVCETGYQLDKDGECVKIKVEQMTYINVTYVKKEQNTFNIELDKEILDMNQLVKSIQIFIPSIGSQFSFQKISLDKQKIQIKINPTNPIKSNEKVQVEISYSANTIQLVKQQEFAEVELFKEKPQNKQCQINYRLSNDGECIQMIQVTYAKYEQNLFNIVFDQFIKDINQIINNVSISIPSINSQFSIEKKLLENQIQVKIIPTIPIQSIEKIYVNIPYQYKNTELIKKQEYIEVQLFKEKPKNKQCQINQKLNNDGECIQMIQVTYAKQEQNIFNIEFDQQITDINQIINNVSISIPSINSQFSIEKKLLGNKIQMKIIPTNPINSIEKIYVNISYQCKNTELIKKQEYIEVYLFKEKPKNKQCQVNYKLSNDGECIQMIQVTHIKQEQNIFNIEFDQQIKDINQIVNNVSISIPSIDSQFTIEKKVLENKIQVKIISTNPIKSIEKIYVNIPYQYKNTELIQKQEYVEVQLYKEKYLDQKSAEASQSINSMNEAASKVTIAAMLPLFMTGSYWIISSLLDICQLIYLTIFINTSIFQLNLLEFQFKNILKINSTPLNLESFLNSQKSFQIPFVNFFKFMENYDKVNYRTFPKIEENDLQGFLLSNLGDSISLTLSILFGLLLLHILSKSLSNYQKLSKFLTSIKNKFISLEFSIDLIWSIYLDISLSTIIQLFSINKPQHAEEYINYILFGISIICTFFPFILLYFVQYKKNITLIKTLTHNLNNNYYKIVLFVRKLYYTIIAGAFQFDSNTQMCMILFFHIGFFIFIVTKKPHNSKTEQYKDIFQTGFFILSSILYLVMMNKQINSEEEKIMFGWIIILMFGIVIVCDVVSVIKEIYCTIKEFIQKRKKAKQMVKIMPESKVSSTSNLEHVQPNISSFVKCESQNVTSLETPQRRRSRLPGQRFQFQKDIGKLIKQQRSSILSLSQFDKQSIESEKTNIQRNQNDSINMIEKELMKNQISKIQSSTNQMESYEDNLSIQLYSNRTNSHNASSTSFQFLNDISPRKFYKPSTQTTLELDQLENDNQISKQQSKNLIQKYSSRMSLPQIQEF